MAATRDALIAQLREAFDNPSDLDGLVLSRTDKALSELSDDEIADLIWEVGMS